jgi:hypothetical protein
VRATPEQREALLKIMSGQETEPGATIFNVFASTLAKVHDPIFAKISIKADKAAEPRASRWGTLSIFMSIPIATRSSAKRPARAS